MTHEWQVLNNQFLNETNDSYKKALKLSKHHDSALNVVCHALQPLPSAARSSGKQIQPLEGRWLCYYLHYRLARQPLCGRLPINFGHYV